ncbi:MAG: histone deacetylase [Thermodesulfobacteriales bacterium]|jgi:acetoin utilization deacetylase AcuC-like enzyme|nr:MAG: histone deacetylase [Thermodesulfobacteriales bacterium]
MAKVGIVLDKLYVDHDNGPGHPETYERILAIVDMLNYTKMMDEVVRIEPRDATKEEITLVHTPEHYDKIASTKGKHRVFLDADTTTCAVSFDAALRAAGGTIAAIDSVLSGEVDRAFPIVRPPGHHAEADRPMGFCLFNNVAVGAAYLTQVKGLNRVLVIDWDVHHGNGTQHIFEDSSKVLYFSSHQFPFYPGTGAAEEVGTGDGKGYTVNVPMEPGMGDNEFIKIFQEILKPIIDQYKPEFILVSAGFDIFFDDPLGGMKVTPEGFAKLTRQLTDQADRVCNGKIIFLLEGGYNLDGLWISTKEMLEELLDKKRSEYDIGDAETKADDLIENIKKVYSDYWDF